MSKINSKLVIKILVLLLCLLSLGAGITLTVFACTNQSEYKENQQIAQSSKKSDENNMFGSNPFLSSLEAEREKNAKEAAQKAEKAKDEMKKYAILSAVMYFVALMMLITFVALLKAKTGIKRSKKA